MTTVSNKTSRPLRLPLPRGKTLHLGPGHTAEIAANAAEHPQLKKLVEAGEIEITKDGSRSSSGGAGGNRGRTGMMGNNSANTLRRSGDR